MHSMVCTACWIKTDATNQNIKKCFRLTIRLDFAPSLAAVVQGSSAADAELCGQRGEGGSRLGTGLRRRDTLLPKCIFLFSCEWEAKLSQDQLLTSRFRAGVIGTQAYLTL